MIAHEWCYLLLECGLQRVHISRHSSLSPDVFQVITSKEAIDWLEEYPYFAILQIGTQGWKILSKVFQRPVLLVRCKGISWNDHSSTDLLDRLTESISGSALVDILIPQDRCLVSVFEDRHISCGSWVITNAYVDAFNPVPAEDRGPSIMWHYIQIPVFDRERSWMYIHMLLYMWLLLLAKGRDPCIMQHYIQSPIFDKKRGHMYN